MADMLDAEQFKDKPPRPLKEIVEDILFYPMDLPEGVAFDRSKLKLDLSPENFKNMLGLIISDAEAMMNSAVKRPSLLARLQGKHGRLRKCPQEDPSERQPGVILSYSSVSVEKLRDALQRIHTTGKAIKEDVAIIQKVAYPVVELTTQYWEGQAQDVRSLGDNPTFNAATARVITEKTDRDPNEVRRRDEEQNKEGVKLFEDNARNLRKGIMPLLDELAAALKISLNKTLAVT